MTAYYNEIDPYAGQWLRNLIDAGHIAPGYVDERSIEDILPNDLNGFTQCHFFAGIGIWSLALRKAGWPDDKQVWTGSCPCQPFSSAGKGDGFADERHLWPSWNHLIEQCKPTVIFGEQVASKDGLNWLDLVQTDLEGQGYAVGANDICAAGVGAPHIRQRLWFFSERLAHTCGERSQEQRRRREEPKMPSKASGSYSMADASSIGRNGIESATEQEGRSLSEISSSTVGLANANGSGPQQGNETAKTSGQGNTVVSNGSGNAANPANCFWKNADWLLCRDDKFRPVEPGSFPLANGATQRVGRLRAYGNAINAEVAKTFIESILDIKESERLCNEITI